MAKRYRPIWISWVDSSVDSGWIRADQIESALSGRPIMCQTAGFLVRQSRHSLIVALSMNEYGGVADVITIPRECVRIIRHLKRGQTQKGGK